MPILKPLILSLLSFLNFDIHAQMPSELIKLRLDPTLSVGGRVSQYISCVDFIPLESNALSQFGKIYQLETTDTHLIILDQETNAILIFTKQGKFHAKIEGVKVSKLYSLNSFKYIKASNLIEIPGFQENILFDLNGKLVKRQKFKDKNNWRFGHKTLLGDSYEAFYYMHSDSRAKNDSIVHALTIVKGQTIIRSYFPYSLKHASLKGDDILQTNYLFRSENDTSAFYIGPYDYYVYRLTPHNLNPAYQFIFPSNLSLPDNFATDTTFNGKRRQWILKNRGVISKIDNFYENDKVLFFKALNTYAYSLATQRLISIDNIIADSLSYFLPITDAEVGGLHFLFKGLQNYDGEYFYTSYSSHLLFQQMDATKDRVEKYPEKLASYFADEKNRKGNPILVRIKFKQSL